MLDFIILCVSIAALTWGSLISVDSAVNLAKTYQVSEFFIGVVILSVGSDLPELVVTVNASFESLFGNDMSGIIAGVSIGSAFTQIGLGIGVTGLLAYLTATKQEVYLVGSIVLISIIVLFLTAYDGVVNGIDGFILLSVFAIYIVMIVNGRKKITIDENSVKVNTIKSWGLLIVGLTVITFSAELVVDSAANLALLFGISQSMVAVFIIGPGTSLPEFAISLQSIKSKKHSLSIGNILGSNVFDTLIPIGVAAIISPVLFEHSLLVFDLPMLLFLSFITLFFLVRTRGVQKTEAILILMIYLTFLSIKLFKI